MMDHVLGDSRFSTSKQVGHGRTRDLHHSVFGMLHLDAVLPSTS